MIVGLNVVRALLVFIKYETTMCKVFLSPTKPLFKVISHIHIIKEIWRYGLGSKGWNVKNLP
jgi:hypothetical protein